MVSDITTQFAEGTVGWKPDPKERDGKDGPWTSYQIKVGDTYYDCAKKVYEAVREDEAIKFTYSTRHYKKRDGSEGKAYKISDLIGPATLHDTVEKDKYYDEDGKLHTYAGQGPPATAPAPRTETPRTGMIGSLPGAEIGAMENRACQMAIAHKTLEPEDIKDLLIEQAWLGSWFKAQPIPNADEPEPIPLQDDPPAYDDAEEQFRSKHVDTPPWGNEGGPDPTEEEPR